jgi:glycosyltransferase involved in cell wall biosynthesis
MRLYKVLHPITHLGVGGATENTLTTCLRTDPARFSSAVLCGLAPDVEKNMEAEAAAGGIEVHVQPSLRRAMHPARDLRAYRELVSWLRKNPVDIVHTHTSKAGIVGRLAAARAGVPVIIHTAHGWGHHNHMHPLKRSLYIALERRAARVTQKIIAVSQSSAERGIADGIGTRDQYTVIHSGIDLARYRNVRVDARALRSSLGIPDGAPVVGTVSRLTPQKAPEDFITVAAMVRQHRPDVRFVFVGGGPDEAAFKEGMREAKLEGTVLPLGYRDDVPQLLRIMDVFMLTSLWEGLPRVFPQAMCASLPVVATRVDGAPEAVVHGSTGFLVAPRDCSAMACFILQLIEDEGLRQSMGQSGYRRVDPDFCDRAMVRRIEEIYDSCLTTEAVGLQSAYAESV